MDANAAYEVLKTLSVEDAKEFLVSRVSVCELAFLQAFADFDELSELSFAIFEVRFPK